MFLGFVILPVFMAAYYGFFKWKGYGKPEVNGQFVGLHNYAVILSDTNFQEAFIHTMCVVVASLIIQAPLAILFALLPIKSLRDEPLFAHLFSCHMWCLKLLWARAGLLCCKQLEQLMQF